jgi:hypothetical protein
MPIARWPPPDMDDLGDEDEMEVEGEIELIERV